MRKTRVQSAIARRMRAAATAAGLSAARIAREWDAKPVLVYRWWNGERRPSEADMERCAALVGVPVEFLERGEVPESVFSVDAAAPEDASLAALSNDALTRLMEEALSEVRRRLCRVES